MGLQPDGDPLFRTTQTERRGQPQSAPQETHFTLAESMRTSPGSLKRTLTRLHPVLVSHHRNRAANRCPYCGGGALRSDHGVEGDEPNGGGISFGCPVLSRQTRDAFTRLAS